MPLELQNDGVDIKNLPSGTIGIITDISLFTGNIGNLVILVKDHPTGENKAARFSDGWILTEKRIKIKPLKESEILTYIKPTKK